MFSNSSVILVVFERYDQHVFERYDQHDVPSSTYVADDLSESVLNLSSISTGSPPSVKDTTMLPPEESEIDTIEEDELYLFVVLVFERVSERERGENTYRSTDSAFISKRIEYTDRDVATYTRESPRIILETPFGTCTFRIVLKVSKSTM